MHFYILVRFHTRRNFCASLSISVSVSGHPVMYARQFCSNSNGNKIYPYTSTISTHHHTLLHNPTIINTETFFAPACHMRQIYRCMSAHYTQHYTLLQNPMILHTKTFFAPACHPCKKTSPTSKYVSNKNSSQNI